MRDFEKVSFEEFKRSVSDDKELYESFKLPTRDSISSAGYDIYLLEDIKLKPNETIKLPTGIKAHMENDEVLLLILRSSMGFKHNLRLVNQVGVIDADYYNNKDNEGHIFIKIQNESDVTFRLESGNAIAQGIFMKYLTTDSDKNLGLERESDY